MSQFDAFARYYDADTGAFEEDIPFYHELARRTGDPILELMCGSGRLLLPLARAGHRLTGVDSSPRMLDLARDKLAQAGLGAQVDLISADVRTHLPAGPFALAIVALNSFMHLDRTADQLTVLTRTHAALRSGGLLVLDLFNPDPNDLARRVGEVVLEKTFMLADGTMVQKFVVQSADPATQINHVTFIYDELRSDGQLRRCALPFTMRWLYRYELEHLLARAGFTLEAAYGSYELDAYTGSSELMLAVARRA